MTVREFDFPDGYVADRIAEHWHMSEKFIRSFENKYFGKRDEGPLVGINEGRFLLAVSSAYRDILRYKIYHQEDPETEKLDCVKRCAYLLKWFMRIRPLYVKVPADGVKVGAPLATLEMANE
ncbi:MAG: hypothetical protein AAFO93_14710, partial [Pseudomonadota bacterium]